MKSPKSCDYRRTFPIFGNIFRNSMIKTYFFLFNPRLYFEQFLAGVEKETLVWIIIILLILLFAVIRFETQHNIKFRRNNTFSLLFRRLQLEIILSKDRILRPQLLTITIRNTGKRDANIEAPVLEFQKIWSKRKFKLNGINGQVIYPMYIDAGKVHQLQVETSSFHQYDREIKSYYWARIVISDVEGRKWKSNKVKLRKSLVT